MTVIQALWILAAVLWAAVFAVAGITVLNRAHRQRTAREPETPERPLARSAAAAARPPLLLSLVRLVVFRRRPAPRRPQPAGWAHQGATPEWSPSRDVSGAGQSSELVTAAETELRWAQIWHDFERDLIAQVDEIFEPRLKWLKDPLNARTCIRLDSAKWQTGEWSIVPNDLALTGLAT